MDDTFFILNIIHLNDDEFISYCWSNLQNSIFFYYLNTNKVNEVQADFFVNGYNQGLFTFTCIFIDLMKSAFLCVRIKMHATAKFSPHISWCLADSRYTLLLIILIHIKNGKWYDKLWKSNYIFFYQVQKHCHEILK